MSQLSQSTREEVLEAYGRECIFCEVSEEEHKEEYGRSLDIHHLIPDRAGGPDEPDNLVPLCIPCHKTMEATHGKAMKQVAKESGVSSVDVEEYNRVKRELEKKRAVHADQKEMVSDAVEDSHRLLEWLSDEMFSATIHVVHETNFTTSRLLYAGIDEETAQKKYRNAENHVTMETIDVSDIPMEEILTESKVERLHDGCNWWLDGFVVNGLEPMSEGNTGAWRTSNE